MKSESEIKELLLTDLPDAAISPHPTKTYLNTIKAIYVTERFNDAYGVGAWTIKVNTEHTDFETGMIVVKVIFEVPELKIYYESYGGNDNGGVNNKNFDLGDAYKGATTDGITKIGSYLGVGIKVFKGPGNAPKTTIETKTDDKKVKWIAIGDKAWVKAVAMKIPLAELRKHFGVSKANAKQYLKEITENIQS